MARIKRIKPLNGTTYDIGCDTQNLERPTGLRGLSDVTLQSLVTSTRANRLAFLPADQIIIEKTTDGGVTWQDAGISDTIKKQLFSEVRPAGVNIPLLNGVRSILCGLRITFTGMKYNVPAGTPETGKYAYWSSAYINAQERYCQLKEFYFWLTASNGSIIVKAQRAQGSTPNSWVTIFEDSSFFMTGWSGCDYIRFSQGAFGGNTSQTTNFWNYRLIFFTRGASGSTTIDESSNTQVQSIYEIRGYGDSVWGVANRYMAYDRLYEFDSDQNAAFPAKVTATQFSGSGASLTALNGSNISSGTVAADRIGSLPAGKITSGTFDTARIPGLSADKITSGTMDSARLPDTVIQGNNVVSLADLNDAKTPGIYWVMSSTVTSGWPTGIDLSSTRFALLEVLKYLSNSSVVVQRLSVYPDSIIYERFFNNTTWYSWRACASNALATTSSAGLMSASDKTTVNAADPVVRGGGQYTGGLNNCRTPGNYWVRTQDTSSGWPEELAGLNTYGFLEVITTGTVFVQRLTRYVGATSLPEVYTRMYVNATWGSWVKFNMWRDA